MTHSCRRLVSRPASGVVGIIPSLARMWSRLNTTTMVSRSSGLSCGVSTIEISRSTFFTGNLQTSQLMGPPNPPHFLSKES